MLVLKRKPGRDSDESKVIITLPDGRAITVHLFDVRGGFARVGVAAPPDVTVDRGEVDRRKRESSRADS